MHPPCFCWPTVLWGLQLDNILLHGRGERPVVKICDFGYSKDEVAGSICKTACGTPEYMAPEVRTHWLLRSELLSLSGALAVIALIGGSRRCGASNA